MVQSVIITEESKQSLGKKLRKYIRENTGSSEYSDGVAEVPLDITTLDRLTAFRYIPRCEEWRAALERMEKGTYGLCILCHEPIPPQDLEFDPLVRLCCKCERGLNSSKY